MPQGCRGTAKRQYTLTTKGTGVFDTHLIDLGRTKD